MAKVFTITEGLENLGALKTGGQGSVYKGKRTGEIFSAVKLLPTPIISEDPNNKQFTDFQNEVNKLKRVNEEPNPNVVKIIGSGITDTGGFPFIEMEFIEGPDLGELLQPPHDKVFSIKETTRVAEHLAHALAHCHRYDVKHGDIKSNNVKYNKHTGNYVLLDFGLAVMSDEQRRTSLRHAGAIEFMAPEQNEGKMLFQTDVYSFGIILFELLTGQVPFQLDNNTETARNQVMLSHMESPVPDLVLLRGNNLPVEWTEEKKKAEMQVPSWLVNLVYKCLEKIPANRFENGNSLYEYICLHKTLATQTNILEAADAAMLQQMNERLQKEKESLKEKLSLQQQLAEEKEKELAILRNGLHNIPVAASGHERRPAISRPAFSGLVLLTIILGSLAAYGLFFKNPNVVANDELVLPIDSTAYFDSIKNAGKEIERKEREKQDKDEHEQNLDPVPADTGKVSTDTVRSPLKKDSTRSPAYQNKDSLYDPPVENGHDANTTSQANNIFRVDDPLE